MEARVKKSLPATSQSFNQPNHKHESMIDQHQTDTSMHRDAVSSNTGSRPDRRNKNIVIDIESDDLTYGQARSIRL